MSDRQILTDAEEFFVKHVDPSKGIAFANTEADDSESILLLQRYFQIPVFCGDLNDVCLAGYQHMAPTLPAKGDRVMCITQPGNRGRLFATAWTTSTLWDLADGMYQVIKIVDRGTPQTIWEGDGILDLSALYSSNRWEADGTIWRGWDGRTVIKIVEIFHNGRTHTDYDVPPTSDPRLAPYMLPTQFHGKTRLLSA